MHIIFNVVNAQTPVKMVFDEADQIFIRQSSTTVSTAIDIAKKRIAKQAGWEPQTHSGERMNEYLPQLNPIADENGVVLKGLN